MTNPVIAPAQPDEHDVPRFVSEEEYLRVWAEQHYEWVDGELIKVSGNAEHYNVMVYLLVLLRAYLELRPIAEVFGEPIVMRLDPLNKRHYREPDIMVIMNENSVGTFTNTGVIGAADICVEIVSPESVVRDYHDKMMEYQRAGVREYWLIDPDREVAFFHVRDADGTFINARLTGMVYTTPLLPDLKIDVSVFWQERLPGPGAVVDMVRAMLTDTPA